MVGLKQGKDLTLAERRELDSKKAKLKLVRDYRKLKDKVRPIRKRWKNRSGVLMDVVTTHFSSICVYSGSLSICGFCLF